MKYEQRIKALIFDELKNASATETVFAFFKEKNCDLKDVCTLIEFLKWVKGKCRTR